MSMSEPHTPVSAGTAPVPATPRPPATSVEGRTRTNRTVVWLGCHLGELAGVGLPTVLAVTVSPWWVTASGTVALLWAVHEYRTHHAHATRDRGRDDGAAGTGGGA